MHKVKDFRRQVYVDGLQARRGWWGQWPRETRKPLVPWWWLSKAARQMWEREAYPRTMDGRHYRFRGNDTCYSSWAFTTQTLPPDAYAGCGLTTAAVEGAALQQLEKNLMTRHNLIVIVVVVLAVIGAFALLGCTEEREPTPAPTVTTTATSHVEEDCPRRDDQHPGRNNVSQHCR